MATKLIFCGDRNWTDETLITTTMKTLYINFPDLVVIEGEADGADKLSREVAEKDVNVPVIPVPAEWEKFGKAAGPIRNTEMLIKHQADGVVAFHLDIMASRGTKNMVQQATRASRPVWVCTMGPTKLAEFIIELKRRKNDNRGVNQEQLS